MIVIIQDDWVNSNIFGLNKRFKEFCEKPSGTLVKIIPDSNIEVYQGNSNFYVGICPTT